MLSTKPSVLSNKHSMLFPLSLECYPLSMECYSLRPVCYPLCPECYSLSYKPLFRPIQAHQVDTKSLTCSILTPQGTSLACFTNTLKRPKEANKGFSLPACANTILCLLIVMQCGFAFLEAGSVRSKNTTNILLKNLLDSCELIPLLTLTDKPPPTP